MAILPVCGQNAKGIKVEIDDEDLIRCENHTWWIGTNVDKRPYTIIRKKHVLLHRFIMENYDNLITIDHKDRNIYNNKKDNLRIATHAQNSWNRKIKKTCNNKYKGVYKVYGNKYIADIMVNGKRHMIGKFKSEEIAAKARDKKAIEFHGEFAYLNFPNFDYSKWQIPEDDRFKQKSSQKGVSYVTKRNIWIVRIQINNKRKYIGSFRSEKDAINSYLLAKLLLKGE